MKILVVEDDRNLASLLQSTLMQQQYQVEVANDGEMGWSLAEAFSYDLILLDLMLPKLDGIRFCQQLRSSGQPAAPIPNQATPVLLMTAVDTVTNRVMGLDAGADDYLVKPFNLDELQARIRALHRRGAGQRSPLLKWGKLYLNPKNCQVTYDGQLLPLTAKEYGLLELFVSHPQQIFSQHQLVEHLWGIDEQPTENAVRAQIKGLRRKLKQAGAGELIETLYKLGYRLQDRRKGIDLQRDIQQKDTLQKDHLYKESIQTKEQNQLVQSGISKIHKKVNLPESSAASLVTLWAEYRQSYCDRVTVLEQTLQALQNGTLTAELQHQAEREAHTLIGSLGSFQLKTASQLARQIQQCLKNQIPVEQTNITRLQQLIWALRQAIETGSTTAPDKESKQPQPIRKEPIRKEPIRKEPIRKETLPVAPSIFSNTLLVIDDDAALAKQLASEAALWRMQTQWAENLFQARRSVLEHPPDVILLDLNFSQGVESGLDFLAELQSWRPEIPVLVFTAGNELTDRVQAARLGSKGFLQKPITPTQVLSVVTQVLQRTNPIAAKLLIVDDDPHILTLLQQILQPQGYQVTVLAEAEKFWETLEQTTPDLLILDIELSAPDLSDSSLRTTALNGFDLCQVIRHDIQWGKLPVLFLSAHTDPQIRQQGFEAGADDFLTKPIVAAELLTRVRNRLEQGQLQQLKDVDALTGVRNRSKVMQDLTPFIRLAQRQQQPFSLAILDLDYFKQVNDQYGHEMGDRVLSAFGKLLSQSFRAEDIVGRWGGEEFIVALYGMAKTDGSKRLQEVLYHFNQQVFDDLDGKTLQVTFSAGIAEFSQDGIDLQTLYRAADAALYRAKAAGRNRVMLAE